LAEAEAQYRQALALEPDHPMALNNLGWTRQMQGDLDGAVGSYRLALARDPRLGLARRNLAVLFARLGRRVEFEQLCREELETSPHGVRWMEQLLSSAMRHRDLTLAGEYAAVFTAARLKAAWRPDGIGQCPVAPPKVFLTVPKLQHDIEQFAYLQRRGVFGLELNAVIDQYRRTIDRLVARKVSGQVPLDAEDERTIGHVFNRVLHIRPTPRVGRALSNTWGAEESERRYLANPPGLVVIDDFLSREALEELRLFCLESTVWSGNRYAHGRLGAFFRDGFNCPLLLQIAEDLRNRLPRLIGDRYPLRQLWGFKNNYHLPGDSTTHADFAAVNVNFWITPTESNLKPDKGGLVIYGVDAPLHWDFNTYNGRSDVIKLFLREHRAGVTMVPYRQNRAIIFNSDLFHCTEEVRFGPSYEDRRINVTMLYGEREDDVHHRQVGRSGPDTWAQGASAWRSAAFGRARRLGG
jgi:hypothetical protein